MNKVIVLLKPNEVEDLANGKCSDPIMAVVDEVTRLNGIISELQMENTIFKIKAHKVVRSKHEADHVRFADGSIQHGHASSLVRAVNELEAFLKKSEE